ncbi:hypothetical protein V8F06_010715 [Rhypophila decipiens]
MIAEKLKRWRDRKLHEFQFVQVAATLLAAAVIGCFSWSPQIEQQQHWLGPAAWYCCLVLSITAVLLSSSEAFIFSAIKNAPATPHLASSLTPPIREEEPEGLPCAAEDTGPRSVPGQLAHGTLSQRLSQELSMIMHVELFEPTSTLMGRARPPCSF